SSRVWSSSVTPEGRCLRIHAVSFSRFDALTTTRNASFAWRKTTRSSMIPPSSLHISVYIACMGSSDAMSLVRIPWRQSAAFSPWTMRRPMCDTSNRPAALRTAKCSSRIELYCWGISQPPKSTIRPPRETRREDRGVRFSALFAVNRVVEVDRVGIDELEQLLVMAAARVGHDLGHVEGALDRPFEPLGDFGCGRSPMQLAGQEQLDPLIVTGRRDQELGVADGRGLRGDGVVHVLRHDVLGKRCEVGLLAVRKRLHGFDEPDGTFLDEIGHRKTLLVTGLSQPDDYGEVRRHQSVLARRV